MRRKLIAAALCLSLWPAAACSSGSPGDNAAQNPGNSASPGASAGPDGTTPGETPAPGTSGAPGGGTATGDDKASCETITAKLSAWGATFAETIQGIPAAGTDVAKIEPIVAKAKEANAKFSAELRAEAGKVKSAELKKMTESLAGALDKMSGDLNAQKIAQDPNALLAIFESPEFAASADEFQKICGTT